MSSVELSDLQRSRRLKGWDRIRAENGLPSPTEDERRRRRARNEKYRNNQRIKQQQLEARREARAQKRKEATPQ